MTTTIRDKVAYQLGVADREAGRPDWRKDEAEVMGAVSDYLAGYRGDPDLTGDWPTFNDAGTCFGCGGQGTLVQTALGKRMVCSYCQQDDQRIRFPDGAGEDCPDCTWRRDCPQHREDIDWQGIFERIATRTPDTAPAETMTGWGWQLSDSRDYDEYGMDLDCRVIRIGWDWPSEECALAAAGEWIVNRKMRAPRVELQVAPDKDGVGAVHDFVELKHARAAYRTHSAGCGCDRVGRTESGS